MTNKPLPQKIKTEMQSLTELVAAASSLCGYVESLFVQLDKEAPGTMMVLNDPWIKGALHRTTVYRAAVIRYFDDMQKLEDQKNTQLFGDN